jgi:hypothetical protein
MTGSVVVLLVLADDGEVAGAGREDEEGAGGGVTSSVTLDALVVVLPSEGIEVVVVFVEPQTMLIEDAECASGDGAPSMATTFIVKGCTTRLSQPLTVEVKDHIRNNPRQTAASVERMVAVISLSEKVRPSAPDMPAMFTVDATT